jgi:hypothetical protein
MKLLFWLSLFWAIVPMLPALWDGGIVGSPQTDLYFSIWSLHIPWMDTSAVFESQWINYPHGQPIYSSAYIKSILAWILSPLLSPAQSYNLLLFAARLAGPLCAYQALRAWGYREIAATGFAVFVTMSPFLHGYAVEGIVEGVDVWPLALWLWACAGQNKFKMAFTLAICILTSWYLGAVACLLTLILATKRKEILYSLLGVAISSPAIWMFVHTHPSMGGIPVDIREAMSAEFGLSTPNFLSKINPFAKNNYIGWCILLAISRSRYTLWALIPLGLSFGLGSELPVLSSVRFPYRWHLATMVLLGFALADFLQKKNWTWLPTLILCEGLLLSGVDFFIPSATAQNPEIYRMVNQPILDVPGPLSLPAGTPNLSRYRASYLLYAQLTHKQPSLWAQDFNGINDVQKQWENWRSWDPLLKITPKPITKSDREQLKNYNALVLIHHNILGEKRGSKLEKELLELGFLVKDKNSTHTILIP